MTNGTLTAGAVGPGFLLVQDYALPDVAKVWRHFLGDEAIDVTNGPSCSSDLNSIEHIWDMYQCILHNQVPDRLSRNSLMPCSRFGNRSPRASSADS